MEVPLDLLYLQLNIQVMCVYFEVGSITCSAVLYTNRSISVLNVVVM